MTPVLATLYFSILVTGLVWAALGVMVFWVWQTGKSAMNWAMLVGVSLTALWALVAGLGISFEGMGWFSVLGAVGLTVGYYLSVKSFVDERIRQIQANHRATADASGPSGPPPSIGSVHVNS